MMIVRSRPDTPPFGAATFRGIALALLAIPRLCYANNHEVQFDEVMAGCAGDPRVQFVEILFPRFQNHWAGCTELAFFDVNGTQTGAFAFPHKPDDPLPEGNSALIATRAFADLPGAPQPDFIIPLSIAAPGGKVCFQNVPHPAPAEPPCFPVNICLSYGDFRGGTGTAGPPAPALPVGAATSLQWFQRFEDPGLGDPGQFNADFRLATPAPRNNQGIAGVVVESGGTCHVEPPAPGASCGNGVIDPGEECDDGDPCTTDRCNASGTCEHAPCGGCLTCDPLTGCVEEPARGCEPAMPGGASLTVANLPDDRRDRVVWHWKGSGPTPKADFGDPLHETDYRLCLYATGDEPAVRLDTTAPAGGVCAGARCWKETRAGYNYRDNALTPDGLLSVRLKGAAAPGTSSIAVAGKGRRLGVPPLPLRTPLRVQLRRSDGNACWEANYSEVHVSSSGATLTAKSD